MFRLHRGALARARASTLAAALATTLALAACGGGSPSPQSPPDGSGGPSTPSGPTAPAPAPAPERFAALGTSADSVSLDWVTPAGSARVRLQRQRADGGYDDVADLPAGPGRVVDTGLAPQTLYRYRLVARDAPTQALAEASATTSDEVAPVTAAGTPQGEPDTLTLGATGGSVASPDGHITLQLPAGALAAGTAVTTQTVSNTAPDGVGPALHVRLAAAPSAALTVRVRWDAAQDPQADGLRIGLQRPDGSWLSLPLSSVDRGTRTLQAEIPAELVPLLSVAPAAARSAAPAADTGLVIVDFTIVKYLGFKLKPAVARVAVGEGLTLVPVARVRGYDAGIGLCETLDPGIEACVIQPILETREIPLLNTKAGYDRRWYVFASEGGDATYGTIAPQGSVGARYQAPAEVPDPDTVLAALHSVNTANGRTVTIASAITIVDDVWVGSLGAVDGPSSAGTTIHADALVVWRRDRASESGATRVYRPVGDVHAWVTDDDCQVTVDPPTQPVSADPRLAVLEIDDGAGPPAYPTYRLRLVTFWNSLLHATCPKASSSTPGLSGWGWEVQGQVSGDGTRIEGQGLQEQAQITWSFNRP